jgi:hypothetical protein
MNDKNVNNKAGEVEIREAARVLAKKSGGLWKYLFQLSW